ncbi:MAG TPA: PHP domain-containing protein [Dehalococcoidia bacterium]|jgi:predicted metal-dependent phosphoesterase TrpH|nr:PHP domain-containing protein [Dehalococcoidia bacterium]
MGSVIDMHIHTVVGSMDSDISPKRLAEQAKAVGLDGVAITEHLHPWRADEMAQWRKEHGLFAFNAREWTTDMGHVGVFGLPPNINGIRYVSDLRRACQDYGAFMVMNHPFRYFPGPSSLLFGDRWRAGDLAVEELAEHPVFSMVDAIEVVNGGCIDRENRLAMEVAAHLGLPTVGGSDAHMPLEVGRYATRFEKVILSESQMLDELKAGRFEAVRRVEPGVYEAVGAQVSR